MSVTTHPPGPALSDGTPTVLIDGERIMYYWDRSLRFWTCYAVDAEENQIGQTQYAPRKADLDSALTSASHTPLDGH